VTRKFALKVENIVDEYLVEKIVKIIVNAK
jgi:hypothetical protein